VDKHVLYPTETGGPQGGICSPVLANLALDGLERRLKACAASPAQQGQRAKINLVRWADDCMITGSSYELLEQEITPLVEQVLHERGLALSPEKTRIGHIEDGCDFLGHHVRKYAGKCLTTPARKNVKAFLGKVRKIVKANKQATTAYLIAPLNPVIRGWATSHRHGASKVTFMKADAAIFKALGYWAKRRRPKQSSSWGARRYFRTRHGRQWIFFGKRADQRGQVHELELFRAGDVPIRRHVKLRGAANPYDPQGEMYVEER
jgi:RNA-directed DNA polymerase